MKNWLLYYYNIDVKDIHQSNKKYHFKIKEYQYYFFPYFEDVKILQNVFKFSEELLQKGIYCHRIIPNKDNQLFTNINGLNYILMVSFSNLDKKITINDIKPFSYIYINNTFQRRDDWKTLWEQKIDYFEYQLSQFGIKHPLLKESFSYFSGYVETGISLLNTIELYKKDDKNLVLSHKRINKENDLFDLYNPFNFVVDYKIRDICEFYKSEIIENKNIINETILYIENGNFSNKEIKLFFIRMLYPSFYFDIFEEIISTDQTDDKIKKVLENTYKYESYIKILYQYIKKHTDIPIVEWLSN